MRADYVYYIVNEDLDNEERIDFLRPFPSYEEAEDAAIDEGILNYSILEFDVH